MSELAERQRARVFFTWSAQATAQPLEIVRGQGATFWTADGARWLDLCSTTWNANLGHGHPRMREALHRAADQAFVAGPTAAYPDKLRAGELLAEIAPRGLAKSFLCLGGAEANENAIKMARLLTGRRKVVARNRSYHGATLAMLSLSGDPRRDAFEPGLPGIVRLADPYCYRCPMGKQRETCAIECADDLETVLLREGPETVAAVVVEGIVGANGVFIPREGYLRRLRELCDHHGVLLIADEVLSGFGRTGRWFAVDHEGVVPDLLTCAKGLTGGYAPGGAVLVHERIARHFDDHVLLCGLTTYAHPVTCAAIVGAIEAYRDERLIERAASLGAWWRPRLDAFAKAHEFVGEVRGLGLLFALELVRPGTREPQPADAMSRVYAALRARHVHLFKRDNLVYLAPPLVSTEAELDEGLSRVTEALEEALAP